MLSAYLRADRVVRPYNGLPYPCLPLRGRWREAPEGKNLSLLFSPPVSLALDSPLTEGAKYGYSFCQAYANTSCTSSMYTTVPAPMDSSTLRFHRCSAVTTASAISSGRP